MSHSSDSIAKKFGAVSFVETPDDEQDTDSENILSFAALKDAFRELSNFDEEPESAGNEEPECEITEYEVSGEFSTANAVSPASLSPQSVIEAVLFTGGTPVSAAALAEKMRNVSQEEVAGGIAALNEKYRRLGSPYYIAETDSKYRMVLLPEYEFVRRRFSPNKERSVKLSQPAIDTLALAAYKQPVSAEDISKLRREPSTALLNQLVKRGLLHKTANGYCTTDRFLSLFGLNSLSDLPELEDI